MCDAEYPCTLAQIPEHAAKQTEQLQAQLAALTLPLCSSHGPDVADIPQLMRMWDDSSAEWDPVQAVLHIQGQPIALKHWHDVYSYGKPGQWAGTKKIWANWQVSLPLFSLCDMMLTN
jgi:hypothetical protein